MNQTDTFKSNENQAAQLSKPVALPDAIKTAWDSWFDAQGVSNDFMQTCNQPIQQVRNSFSRHTQKLILKVHLPNFFNQYII